MEATSFVRNYALTCYTFDGEEEDYLVARLIHRYMTGKRVLDLGCGPVVAVTSIFYPSAKEVVAVDRLQENLDFVKNNSDELKFIVSRANKYKCKYLLKKDSSPKITLIKGDVVKKLKLGNFDSVMNLGCFGALNTEEQFFRAVKNTYYYLKKGGTLLMVNWLASKHVERPFRFNGKVNSLNVYIPSMKKAGFKINQLHVAKKILSKETRQLGYDRIVWAVAEK